MLLDWSVFTDNDLCTWSWTHAVVSRTEPDVVLKLCRLRTWKSSLHATTTKLCSSVCEHKIIICSFMNNFLTHSVYLRQVCFTENFALRYFPPSGSVWRQVCSSHLRYCLCSRLHLGWGCGTLQVCSSQPCQNQFSYFHCVNKFRVLLQYVHYDGTDKVPLVDDFMSRTCRLMETNKQKTFISFRL